MLKRLLIILSILALGLLLYSVFVENIFSPRLSPKDSAKISLNDLDLKVEYNRPSKRERDIFGALVPFNKVWRAGANENTTISFDKEVTIKGNKLPTGKYGFFIIPSEEGEWEVIFSKKNDAWGSNGYSEENDQLRVKLRINKVPKNTEQMTFTIDKDNGILFNWEKTLLLMEVGYFYEIYTKLDVLTKEITEPQIIDLRRFTDLAAGNHGKDANILGFSAKDPHTLEKYVEKIINNGYTAVVYKQDTPGKNATRSLSGIYSPGTFLSEMSENISNNLSCIWIESHKKSRINTSGNIVIGMANIDNFTGKSNYYEIITENLHNPTTYDELERFISSYNPNECIIISNIADKEMTDIMTFIKLDSKKHHIINKENTKVKNAEKQTYQREILDKFDIKYRNIPLVK
jgi:hypothetical protein